METVAQKEKSIASHDKKDDNYKKTKIKSLQGLRAVAILAIFISHTGLGNLEALGAWGVSVFFVLSGFVMMYSYFPRKTIPKFGFAFAWNKIKKLYPLHIITMLLAAFYTIIIVRTVWKTILDICIHTLLIQMWIPKKEYYSTLNGPSWYLCASVFMYFMFPLVLGFFKEKMSKKKAIIIICALFVAEFFISSTAAILNRHSDELWLSTKWLTYFFPPVRFIDFLTGCCLGFLFLNIRTYKNNCFLELATCILIPISILIYVFEYGILSSPSVKYSLLFLPTSMMLIWIVANEKSVIAKVFSTKIFVWFGDLSPYIFLIHGVMIKYCRSGFSYVFSITNTSIVAVVSFVATIIGAVLWKSFTKKTP